MCFIEMLCFLMLGFFYFSLSNFN